MKRYEARPLPIITIMNLFRFKTYGNRGMTILNKNSFRSINCGKISGPFKILQFFKFPRPLIRRLR